MTSAPAKSRLHLYEVDLDPMTVTSPRLCQVVSPESGDQKSNLYTCEVVMYVDGKPVVSKSKDEDKKIEAESKEKQRKTQKPPFKFHMIGLNVGDTIVFDPLRMPVRIASDDKIEYDGRLYSLSAFTANFLPEEKQNTSGAYQGPKYFSYNGKVLSELRKEKEQH